MTSYTDSLQKDVDWTLYDDETPALVVQFFQRQLQILDDQATGVATWEWCRWRIHYGDRQTGRSWELADEGYVALGETIEGQPRLLLMHNKASREGKGIMMSRIIKIEPCNRNVNDGRPFYRHADFFRPKQAEVAQIHTQNAIALRHHRGILLRRRA